MKKPKIEDFIPPGWYAAMDEDGGVLTSKGVLQQDMESWVIPSCNQRTRFSPEHAAMFDLSIFGDDWEKSLFQKPTELQPCPVCGGSVAQGSQHIRCLTDGCWLIGPSNDPDGSKWNRLRYEAE